MRLRVVYDRRADVLYVTKGMPVPALTEQADDGLLLRWSIDTDQPVGVTIPRYSYWLPVELVDRIAHFLNVPRNEASVALSSIETEKHA